MIVCERDTFPSVSGQPLTCRTWMPEGKPVGIVQLVHGMAEHIDRYDAPARALAEAGYVVVGHTHLGHGEQADILGFFGDRDGWQRLVEDVHGLRLRTQKRFPALPYVLLGHSMGSFVVRCYLMTHGEGLTAAVISGTGYFAPAVVGAGLAIANVQCALGGARKPSKLINQIGFAGSNKPFAPNRTDFDWLTRVEAEVDKYVADPYCGFLFTASGYRELFRGLKRLNQLGDLKRMPRIPVLFLSGGSDPVGAMGVGVNRVADQFRDAGMQDVTVRLYPEGRHEMFNEVNREEVYRELTAWLDSKTQA